MNFLIDISVEPDTLMFVKLIEALQERGHDVILTARRIPASNKLQRFLGFEPYIIGEYSDTLEGKLLASSRRIINMVRLVKKLTGGKLDGVLSNSSVEASRIGFGLNCKVHTFNDHITLQSSLIMPLSTYVYTPWINPVSDYTKYGLEDWQVISYRGFLINAWMPYIHIDPNVPASLGLNPDKPIIVFRESEVKASYLLGKKDITVEAVKVLAKKRPDIQFVARPRYSVNEMKSRFSKNEYPNVKIIQRAIDMRSLLAKSSVFIGGGATMCMEAAYLGIPTINTRPIKSPMTDFLEQQDLAIKANTIKDIVNMVQTRLDSGYKEQYIRRAENVFKCLEFPMDKLIEKMEHG